MAPDPLTCVHSAAGLCPSCRADYDEDPEAWAEFGEHPEGIRRWAELQREIDRAAAEAGPAVVATDDVPF